MTDNELKAIQEIAKYLTGHLLDLKKQVAKQNAKLTRLSERSQEVRRLRAELSDLKAQVKLRSGLEKQIIGMLENPEGITEAHKEAIKRDHFYNRPERKKT